jgi:hypothetical protein
MVVEVKAHHGRHFHPKDGAKCLMNLEIWDSNFPFRHPINLFPRNTK